MHTVFTIDILFCVMQVIIQIPYSFLQALLFSTITYPAINFYWSAHKVFMYFYTMFCTMLFFNYFGMLLVSLTPTYQTATIFASFCNTMLNLFAGFLIPEPVRGLLSFFCSQKFMLQITNLVLQIT